MKLLAWQSSLRDFLERKHFLLFVYFLFLLGFFVSPSVHWHNNSFYAFVVFPYLLTLEKRKLKLLSQSKIWTLSMAFAAYLCLTLLWTQDAGEDGPVYFLRRPIYLFVFLGLTIELAQNYPKFIERLFMFLCWVGAITAVVSVLSSYSDVVLGSKRFSHLADQLHNPIEFGAVYGMLVLVLCFRLLKWDGLKFKSIYLVLLGILLTSAVLTQSRGPLVALALAVLVGGILSWDKKVLVGLVVVVAALVTLWRTDGYMSRIFEGGLSHRLELGKETLVKAQDSLLFGKGIGTDTRITLADGKTRGDGHNAYLGTILYGGLAGLLLLLALIAVAMIWSVRYFVYSKNVTYVALLLFGVISMITGENELITHPDSLWMFFWLPLALLAGEEIKRRAQGECKV